MAVGDGSGPVRLKTAARGRPAWLRLRTIKSPARRRGTAERHRSAFSPRVSREVCQNVSPYSRSSSPRKRGSSTLRLIDSIIGAYRHCERSEAIHGSARKKASKSGLLRRCAPRNDVQTHFRDLAARCARVVQLISALKTEGVGNAGCPMHPQPRVRYW
jgi:hypothetical protein